MSKGCYVQLDKKRKDTKPPPVGGGFYYVSQFGRFSLWLGLQDVEINDYDIRHFTEHV